MIDWLSESYLRVCHDDLDVRDDLDDLDVRDDLDDLNVHDGFDDLNVHDGFDDLNVHDDLEVVRFDVILFFKIRFSSLIRFSINSVPNRELLLRTGGSGLDTVVDPQTKGC